MRFAHCHTKEKNCSYYLLCECDVLAHMRLGTLDHYSRQTDVIIMPHPYGQAGMWTMTKLAEFVSKVSEGLRNLLTIECPLYG